MMKHFLLFILSIFSFAVIAQEQITNIVGAGSTTRYILKEYSGDKYIMATFPSDSLRVYKMMDGVAVYKYSRKFDGIYAMAKYNSTDQFLLLSDATGSIAYNFTNNTTLEIPYEGSLEYTNWHHTQSLGDEVMLRQSTKDFTESKKFLYNLATGQHQILNTDHIFLKLGEEKLYAYTYASDTTYQIYVINKENLTVIDSTITPILNANRYFFDGEEHLVYIQKNEVKRYNFTSEEHELIKTIDQAYRSISISQSYDQYVVDLYHLGNHIMIRLHPETLVSSQFIIEEEIRSPHPNILYGKYLILDFNFVVIDTSTGQKFMFPSITNKSGYAIIEDRFVIYTHYYQHLMLDLTTMENHVLAQKPENSYASNTEVMYDNGIYLVNFDNFAGNDKKLFEINLVTKTGKYSNVINGISEGLIEDSRLIKINDDVILVNSEDLYLVKGNSAIKLNTNLLTRIRHTDFKVQNNKLYWCEYVNSEYNIYTLQNETAVKLGTIPNTIGLPPFNALNLYDYVVTPNAIFIANLSFEHKQYKYDIQTQVIEQISTVNNSEYFGFYHEGNYYYTDIKKIKILKADGSTTSINLTTTNYFFNPFFTYKNRLFYGDKNGLFEIVNESLKTIIPIENGIIVNYFESNGYIHVNNFDEVYLYDGTSTFPLVTSNTQYLGERILEDYFVFYEGVETNTTVASLLNFKTNTSIPLPTEVANLNNISVFRNAGKYVLMGSEGFALFNKVLLFETDENLSFFTKIKEFDVVSNGVISSFTEYTNEGFLYTGNTMYLMDTLLNFVPIDELIGENQSSTVYEQDGYFYFVAIHPVQGRQLYRIQPFSLRTSVDDAAAIFTKVNIYPNPASQEIYFEGGLFRSAEIYHISGTMVQQSPVEDNNKLNIGHLQSGTYVVILTSQIGEKRIGKFIKVD